MSLTGQRVGKYIIGPLLGEGGMAEVYMGEQADGYMARKVAIKALLAEHCYNEEVVNRFMNEARALGRINHPGVVAVYDVARLPDGRACSIMEYLAGPTLRAWLTQRGRLTVDEALVIAIQLAEAMAAAHDQQIIHRDLKPDNVFVLSDTTGLRAKIVDFGIAKLIGDAGLVKTSTQAQLGTAPYMSPEQFRSSADVDHRADLYALGCVLFEMLCGHTPFAASNLVEHMRAHAFQPPPALRTIVPDAPVAVEQVILRLLAKNPAERFGSMRELKQVLEVIRAGGSPDVWGQAAAPQAVPAAYPASASSSYPAAPVVADTGAHAQASSPERPGRARGLVILLVAFLVIAVAVAAMLVFG